MAILDYPRWGMRMAALLAVVSWGMRTLYPGLHLDVVLVSFPPYLSGAPQLTGFGSATTAYAVAKANEPRIKGKIAIITGANSGVGYETSRVLGQFGAHVIMACRSMDKAEKAIGSIKSQFPNARLTPMLLDTSSLSSVRDFANAFKGRLPVLDILVLNAGVMAPPPGKSVDGIEIQFATNHLGHFLLAELLKEPLRNAVSGRVITTSSFAHAFPAPNGIILDRTLGYGHSSSATVESWNLYGQSKLANLLHAFELNRRSDAGDEGWTGVSAYSLNPGFIHTNLQTYWPIIATLEDTIFKPIVKNLEQGAATTVFCAIDSQATPGAYHEDCNEKPVYHEQAHNVTLAFALWEESKKLVSEYL